MDFQQCFSILQARPSMAGNDELAEASTVEANASSTEQPAPPAQQPASDSLSSYELVKECNRYQEKRIAIYRYFDDELRDIIEGNCPARYPIICSEVTQQFTVVSTSINHIKDLLITRGKTELSASISKIQSLEKEKLLLVAAHHLDQLKSTVLSGTENVTGSKTPEQVAYLAKQILTCQQQIAECMEEIQCHLCDLVEEE